MLERALQLETQVIERFEKTDKVRRDSTSSTGEIPFQICHLIGIY